MADISMRYLLHDKNQQTPVPLKNSDVLYGRPLALGPSVLMKLYQMLNMCQAQNVSKKFNYLTAHYWSLFFITLLTFVGVVGAELKWDSQLNSNLVLTHLRSIFYSSISTLLLKEKLYIIERLSFGISICKNKNACMQQHTYLFILF